MIRKDHRSVDPGMLVGDQVLSVEHITRLFKLLQDNPHLSATQLIEMVALISSSPTAE